ncbi:hypothetical protein [Pelagovum sp. HNIBRBA483]
MKSMWIAFVAIFVVAYGADRALDYTGFSAQEKTSGPSVRLD